MLIGLALSAATTPGMPLVDTGYAPVELGDTQLPDDDGGEDSDGEMEQQLEASRPGLGHRRKPSLPGYPVLAKADHRASEYPGPALGQEVPPPEV